MSIDEAKVRKPQLETLLYGVVATGLSLVLRLSAKSYITSGGGGEGAEAIPSFPHHSVLLCVCHPISIVHGLLNQLSGAFWVRRRHEAMPISSYHTVLCIYIKCH